jgi:hypothetical protein
VSRDKWTYVAPHQHADPANDLILALKKLVQDEHGVRELRWTAMGRYTLNASGSFATLAGDPIPAGTVVYAWRFLPWPPGEADDEREDGAEVRS